ASDLKRRGRRVELQNSDDQVRRPWVPQLPELQDGDPFPLRGPENASTQMPVEPNYSGYYSVRILRWLPLNVIEYWPFPPEWCIHQYCAKLPQRIRHYMGWFFVRNYP